MSRSKSCVLGMITVTLMTVVAWVTVVQAIPASNPCPPVYVFTGDQELPYSSVGRSVGRAGDINNDGYDDIVIGECDNDAGSPDAGRVRVYSGVDGTLLWEFPGEQPGSRFGVAVSGAGDVDGDGFGDIVVGADVYQPAGVHGRGKVYVYSGRTGAELRTFVGRGAVDQFGASVASAGDVNDDGLDDVIIGAPVNGAGAPAAGRAYVYSVLSGMLLHQVTGTTANENVGFSVSGAGDIDNDGFGDFIVGAAHNDSAGLDAGRATVYSGQTGSIIPALDFFGNPGSWMGSSVSSAGDVNGDGFPDVIIGGDNLGAGHADVYSGAGGALLFSFSGEAGGDRFGRHVSGAGDFDNDGYDDMLVGACGNDANGANAGRAYIFFGGDFPMPMDINASDADVILSGEYAGDYFGWGVTALGYINDGDVASFAVAAFLNDNGGRDAGRAYVYSLSCEPAELCGLLYCSGETAGSCPEDPAIGILDVSLNTLIGCIGHPNWGSGGAGRAMAFGPNGHLYVVNLVNSQTDPYIYEFDEDNRFVDAFTIPGLQKPHTMTFGPDGYLYVSEFSYAAPIFVYDIENHTVLCQYTTNLTAIGDLKFGPNGHLFIGIWGAGAAWIEEWDASCPGPWLKVAEYRGTGHSPSTTQDRWSGIVFVGSDSLLGCTTRQDSSKVEVFSISSRQYLGSLIRYPGYRLGKMALGPDGLLYVRNAEDHALTAFDPYTGAAVQKVCEGCPLGNSVLAFSPLSTGCLEPEPVAVHVDIKPRSCPNPLNVKFKGYATTAGDSPLGAGGVLPVAVLGTDEFDVTTIDPTTVQLVGVHPIRWSISDVGTPVLDDQGCDCTTNGPDFYDDLTLKFNKAEIIAALGNVQDGDVLELELAGELNDGGAFIGSDCVLIRAKKPINWNNTSLLAAGIENGLGLVNQPNPFNAGTNIAYLTTVPGHVTLTVYNILGQHVVTLVDAEQAPGEYSIHWDGRDDHGRDLASGVYPYRLQAGDVALTRKMTLLK